MRKIAAFWKAAFTWALTAQNIQSNHIPETARNVRDHEASDHEMLPDPEKSVHR